MGIIRGYRGSLLIRDVIGVTWRSSHLKTQDLPVEVLEPAESEPPLYPKTFRLSQQATQCLQNPYLREAQYQPFGVDPCNEERNTLGIGIHERAPSI